MGICEILTIIFVVCKLLGIISWGWVLVLLPEIIAVVLYVIYFTLLFASFRYQKKQIEKRFKK